MQLRKLGKINFPKSNDININMMPFIIGDKMSIPKEYQHYYPLIETCLVDSDENGKVGYLSISESFVKKNTSQRRSGIHTEKPSISTPLVWITDSCPHESMILSNESYRQWFRFVTSKVSIWYSKHSTPNRLGVLPTCEIIGQSKFA